ncbi:hypothetical protein [Halopiger thermotolerans]
MVLASVVVFLASLCIGALGIYVGARVVVGAAGYGRAIVTALIGAIVWALVGFFIGWVPLLGPILALLAYVAVIYGRYPGGWTAAGMIGLVGWVTVLVVLHVLAGFGITGFNAVGVPGI